MRGGTRGGRDRSRRRVGWLGWAALLGVVGCEEPRKVSHEPEPLTPADVRGQSAAEEREARRSSATDLAPAPLRPGLPLIGQPGKDADGYPTQFVDRAQLRSQLYHARYEDLDRHFTAFQEAFERDPRHEYWAMDAADAFASAEPELGEALDAWVAASPSSFAAYLARGTHRTRLAYALRGARSARDTPAEDFAALKPALAGALEDLARALELRPGLVAASRVLIQARLLGGGPAERAAAIERATSACPACFQVRVTSIFALAPRWGGSYEEMGKLALAARAELNPRFRLLPGYIDLDKARRLRTEKRYPQAIEALAPACALGEHWEFLQLRGALRRSNGELAAARADLARALALRPGIAGTHFERALLEFDEKAWEAAGLELLAGLRLDPTAADGRALHGPVVQGLIHQGWSQHLEGQVAEAVRVLDLAIELDPSNAQAHQRRTVVLGGGRRPDAARVAAMQALFAERPDDLLVLRQLDYALAFAREDFERIDGLWTAYLARHPDEGRAFLERGGARRHLDRPEDSRADLWRACQLGFSEGCALALREQ